MTDQPSPGTGGRMARRPLAVLVVEDDLGHAELIARAFEDADERVALTVSRTLAEGQRAMAERHHQLVIADLRLPDGQGLDLLAEPAGRQCPLIAMTSHGDEQVAVDAMKRGASDYIVKSPVTLEAMPRIARRVLNDWENLQARQRLEAQLQQVQKLEGLGHLAGNVAHDFNNLLTVVLGNAELVRATIGERSPVAEEIGEILAAGRRAATLASQLLAFARRQPMSAQRVNLARVLANVDPLLRRLLGASIELVTIWPDDPCPVVIDAHQVEQVLLNLAVNARDAMPEGGRLTVELRALEIHEGDATRWPDAGPGSHVHLMAADTGPGIDPSALPHVFEPFFTTKGAGRGTGLGLSICYGIVVQSGGHIVVESEPGRGATFHMLFPSAARADDADAFVEERPLLLPSGEETILLVDDEAMVRSLAARMLRLQGYTVFDVALGSEAIERARALTRLDLLITDVVMPQMSGRQLADRLWAEFPGLPVVFISGFGPPEVGSGLARAAGRWTFLPKPFAPDTLARHVRNVLDASTA
jgi:two-component system cell cycle sensor histidine kinase/response regulator CckA